MLRRLLPPSRTSSIAELSSDEFEATAKFPVEAGIARYGMPKEIAELMVFVVSPAARWMTGSTLRMDGGEVKSI
jgi:NAD(P)-dependent dehydrogenase (short-subunit alcohol dehydrogenase family)